MKKLTFTTLSWFIVCLSFISCSKDFRFQGITPTSVAGELIGPEDTDDWRLDDDWGTAVHKLFDEQFEAECSLGEKSLKEGTDKEYYYRVEGVGPAFPNPATSFVVIDFYLAAGGKVQVLLVDRSHHVVLKECIDLIIDDNHTLNIDISDIEERGELYRLFYKHISDAGTFCGHGDILVE